MILFLTSSPFLGFLMPFNDENEFILRLRRDTTGGRCALFVTSDPEDVPFTEKFAQAVQNSLFRAGIDFPRYRILDGRNKEKTEELVEEADFIILAGGHVPTQNAFFQEIGLKECMKKYQGVVMGGRYSILKPKISSRSSTDTVSMVLPERLAAMVSMVS